jgi:hypothetical protein
VTGILKKPQTAETVVFQGTKGKPLTVELLSGSPDRALTPILKIFDSKGKQLVKTEPTTLSGDCLTTFTPPTDDSFRIEVSDLYGKGSERSIFLLRVLPVEPDFQLTVTTDRYTISPEKPLDLPITLIKKNGFKEEIEVQALDLPEGLGTRLVPTSGKTDGSVLTLRVTATKVLPGVPFRLVGRVKSDTNRSRPVGVAGATDSNGQNLWLTIQESPKK